MLKTDAAACWKLTLQRAEGSSLDNLTHTLFGLTLARTALGRAGRGTTAALVVASNAPDVDIVATASGALSYLRWHRGPTHGPIGLIGLGLATASLVWLWYDGSARLKSRRLQARTRSVSEKQEHAPSKHGPPDRDVGSRSQPSFSLLAVVSMIGVLMHVLMDLPTSYGTRPLSPFDWHWYATDWMPVVDIYLLIALAAGLAMGRTTPGVRRHMALIVLILMAANYGMRAVAHHEALALAPRLFGPTLPQRCAPSVPTARIIDRWPRSAPPAWTAPSGHRCLVEIAAIPTFLSPFRWRVLAQMSNAYEIRDMNVLDPRLRDPASDVSWRVRVRYPNLWTPAVERAATTRLGQVFLGFSRFPAARWTVDGNGITTVRWDDLRFTGAALAADQPLRPPSLFTAMVRVDAAGRVIEERLGR
ncbi:MAG: hypothetical protein DMF97_01105 [Acidobacteria bacterium]|nr:MAG: hypothetical protein DMF97_01105 [Acidobacteriota bacterium]